MASISSIQAAGNHSGAWPVTFIQNGFEGVSATIALWRDRTSRRRAAVAIDDRTLADIGLFRAQIDHEAAKPFWRA